MRTHIFFISLNLLLDYLKNLTQNLVSFEKQSNCISIGDYTISDCKPHAETQHVSAFVLEIGLKDFIVVSCLFVNSFSLTEKWLCNVHNYFSQSHFVIPTKRV